MPEFGISDDKLMDLLGAKGGGDSGDAGDTAKAERARAKTQANKAMKLQKDSMNLQIKQIYLQKQQVQLEMLKKRQATQSGGSGGIGIGGVATGAAIGIVIVRALRSVANNSMILSKSISFINKMLGLLIDFILLPFLPLLIDALINLANAVIAFGDLWASIVKDPGNVGNAGKEMASLGNVDIPMLIAQLAGALVGGIVGFLVGGPGGALIGAAIVSVIAGALVSLEYIAGGAFGQLIKDTFYPLGNNYMQWMKDTYTGIIETADTVFKWLDESIRNTFTNLINFIIGLIESIPGYKESKTIAKGVNDFVGGKPVGDVIVQVSGTVFKDEVDLYQSIASRLRTEIFRFFPGG